MIDETTAPTLTAITGAQRRLDATTSARELARGVTAHVEMANRMLARAGKTPYAAAASEAAEFAAWLHADMYDIGSARAYYRMAIGSARQAGQDLLAGYRLGSLAAFETDGGDPELGLTLVGEARQQIGATQRPSPGHGWTPTKPSASPRRAATATPPRTPWPAPRGPSTPTGRQNLRPGPGCSRSTTPSWPGTGRWSQSGSPAPATRSPRSPSPSRPPSPSPSSARSSCSK